MKMTIFNQNTSLIIIHENEISSLSKGRDLLRFATCSEPLADIALSCLNGSSNLRRNSIVAIPQDWDAKTTKIKPGIVYYKKDLPISPEVTSRLKANPWLIISNARFVTQVDHQRLYKMTAQLQADVVAVDVVPQLRAAGEKVLTTSQSKLIGFRRLLYDLAQLAPIPDDWPCYLFVKTDIFNKLLVDNVLPLSFPEFINRCSSSSLTVRGLNIGGTILDLETEEGLLGLLVEGLNSLAKNRSNSKNLQNQIPAKNNTTISDTARLFGKVLLGQNVTIGPNAIIVGPTIIGNDAKIAKAAIIRTSIIGPGVSVPRNHIVQNRVLIVPQHNQKHGKQGVNMKMIYKNSPPDNFRTWPRFSYAGCFKRMADIVAAIVVLILFAPVVPIIALAVKLASRGPIFFKDPRQGLYGKVFSCIKFRTMLVGADKIQDKLRALNQADGPQFKLADDPRLSAVGKFLRNTYIDEIPQFVNVLLGQMSIVGPRPSPEAENTLCPPWRDARLSVRPGITGLWQVCRTRQPMKDFQEWIHYDIKYVRNLSLKADLWICWQTVRKMMKNFIDQF